MHIRTGAKIKKKEELPSGESNPGYPLDRQGKALKSMLANGYFFHSSVMLLEKTKMPFKFRNRFLYNSGKRESYVIFRRRSNGLLPSKISLVLVQTTKDRLLCLLTL